MINTTNTNSTLRLAELTAAVLVCFASVTNAGTNLGDYLYLTPKDDNKVLDYSSNGLLDASQEGYRHLISAQGKGQKFSVSILGNDLILKKGQFNPADDDGGWTTIGIEARSGATLDVGSVEKPLTSLNIQNHGVDTLATGLKAWRGRGETLLDSHININSDLVNIDVSSDNYWAYGIHAFNNTTGNIADADRSSVIINADKININVNSNIEECTVGIIAWSQAKVKLTANEIYLKAYRVINARGGSIVEINSERNETSVIQLNGDIAFEFDGKSSGTSVDAVVDINLTNSNSYWNGNLQLPYANYNPAKHEQLLKVTNMKLGLSNGAQWTPSVVTEGQNVGNDGLLAGVNKLALNTLNIDKGIINVTGEDIDVTVEKMNGTGTVNLAVDGNKAGKFTVQAAKDASLDVNLMDAKMEKELSSDDINADQAKTLLSNVGGQGVETKTEVKEGLVNNGFGVNSKGETTTNSANTLMQSSLEMASAAPLALNRIMMNDVRKRLGDIRTSNGTHGAWARYDGGKLSGEGGLENDFHTIQVGIDTVPTADAPRMGVAFSYTDSDTEYARGSADMKAYSLAMYSTWMGDNGQFFDLIGRMGTADTDMVVDGQHKGSMDNVALSMSGEFGWRFDVTNSIYVEPQVEATYTYVNEDSLSLSTANYDVDAVHSLLGRIGFAAGMKCPSDYGNVYVRASAVHEFLGDSKITGVNAGNTNVYEIDGKDTWFEYGIGANFNLTKSTYMWADVERTTGGALDEDWRATVGVRYAW